MRHLLVCRDFPPVPCGGIAVYTRHLARVLVEAGETVHVLAQQWKGAEKTTEEIVPGRFYVHRIPFVEWRGHGGWVAHTRLDAETKLMHQCCASPAILFGWQACPHIERLVETEKIDIIEASEYEAPLYYFMLRRALGLGPHYKPACLVHLHACTEIVAQHDDEDLLAPFRSYSIRHEEYCIAASDALITPSEAMKAWAINRYDLPENKLKVIPYPLGKMSQIAREDDVWSKGTVTFFGRLQPVKGIFEFIRAAIEVAPEFPDVKFDFIGGDTACLAARNESLLSILQDIIPPQLKKRFRFTGNLDSTAITRELAHCRIGVVPSRWETFPNACLELMASGLPVLGTNAGGIPEIITDGKTGWLAPACSTDDLAATLRQALSAPPEELRSMGQRASDHVQNLCGNGTIIARHIDYRNRIAGSNRRDSISLPPNLPRARQSFQTMPARKKPSPSAGQSGIAIVIPCYNQGRYLGDCLKSIQDQSVEPVTTVIVDDGSTDAETLRQFKIIEEKGWRILHKPNGGVVSARNLGIRTIVDSGLNPLGIVCLDSDDRLRPEFIQRCEQMLKNCPEVGVVSCWVQHFEATDRLWMQPCPTFPYQWTTNEIATFSAVRTEAMLEVGLYKGDMDAGYEDWDFFNAIMAVGWVGITIPEVLGEYRVREDSILRRLSVHAHGRMRRVMLQRFADQVAADAVDVALLSEAADSWILRDEVFTLRAQVARARTFLKRPDRAIRWLAKKLLARGRKAYLRWTA